MTRRSIKQYRSTAINNLKEADPYTQVAAVMNHIIGCISAGTVAIEKKDHATKGLKISNAIELVGFLQAALDEDVGADCTNNLYDLYDYITVKLGEGSTNNDTQALQDALSVMKIIKEGWDGIPVEDRVQTANPVNDDE